MPNWFYYDAAGIKQGPVNNAQLKALAQSGFITWTTILETEAGQTGEAGRIRGLFGMPSPESGPVAPPSSIQMAPPGPTAQRAPVQQPVSSPATCDHCGSPLNPGQEICLRCGARAQQAPNPNREIADYYVWSLVVSLFCCTPLGIISLIFSLLARASKGRGDYATAREQAGKAKVFFWIGFSVGLLLQLLWTVIQIRLIKR